jgi:hypothetical protein
VLNDSAVDNVLVRRLGLLVVGTGGGGLFNKAFEDVLLRRGQSCIVIEGDCTGNTKTKTRKSRYYWKGRVSYALGSRDAYDDVCVPVGGLGVFVCLC